MTEFRMPDFMMTDLVRKQIIQMLTREIICRYVRKHVRNGETFL